MRKLFLPALLSVMLVACGGGGSEPKKEEKPAHPSMLQFFRAFPQFIWIIMFYIKIKLYTSAPRL